MLDQLLPKLRAARAAMDGDAADWSRLRAPLTDQDRVLLSQTHLWLRSIPTPLHPKQLCRHHPRVANRIAMTWDDLDETDRLLEDLMNDRRGKRRGFPERVVQELQRLERFHARRPRMGRSLLFAERLRRWATRHSPKN